MKRIDFVATCAWNDVFSGMEGICLRELGREALEKHPVDMLVFEAVDDTHMQVRSAGYDLATSIRLDEKTVVKVIETPRRYDTFWLKLDDYGDHNIATFLFPEDY